jgi:predicted transposase YbfD/YdcC
VHDLPAGVRKRLGIERVPPSVSAIRRVMQAVDPHLPDTTVCGWLATRVSTSHRWPAIGVDGKSSRGARIDDGRAVHLIAALERGDGVVLAQRVVDGKTNDITEFAPLSAGIGFPHARAGAQVTRRRRALNGRKWCTETGYAITDLDQSRPDEISDTLRGHWHIENRLRWVRDITFGEDLSRIRTDHGPAVMATLRNLAISVHRRHGATNITVATRRVSRHPHPSAPTSPTNQDQH